MPVISSSPLYLGRSQRHRPVLVWDGVAGEVIPPWWDPNEEGLCVWAAYKPKGAADLATSYLDLSGNGNHAAPGVAPTLVAGGWQFNGSTQWLDTGFIPQNDQSQSVLCQFSGATISGRWVWGLLQNISGTQRFGCIPLSGANSVYHNGNGFMAAAPNTAAGNLGVAGNTAYRNGAPIGTPLPAYTGQPTTTTYIGCVDNGGAAAGFQDCIIPAFVIYDCVLTDAQFLTVYTAMAAL